MRGVGANERRKGYAGVLAGRAQHPRHVTGVPRSGPISASRRRRRLAAVLLCAACMLLASAAAATARTHAPRARVRATAASEPMCCFTLNISADEELVAKYNSASSTNPQGEYTYILEGTADGLATLIPSDGPDQAVFSTEGGVAAGFGDELNHVKFEGEPFGCPPNKPTGVFENLDFRRTAHDDPVYGRTGFEFGPPFGPGGRLVAECNWGSETTRETGSLLSSHGYTAMFLNGLSEGPASGSAFTVGGLLKGEHEKNITCFQEGEATLPYPPRIWSSTVAVTVSIVHYSRDDRKRLLRRLRSYIGRPQPQAAASKLARKDEETHHPNGCTS